MNAQAKRIINTIVRLLVNTCSRNRIGQYLLSQILHASMETLAEVSYHNLKLQFGIPNQICDFRIKTFTSKEPETLEWIDRIPEGSVLWDIGANIGLYSCYAAKARKCRVFAFEPSVFNLELLARNIFANHLVDSVTVVPLPLSDFLQTSTLNMTSTEWGGALSSFGEVFGDNGLPMQKVFEFRTIGLTMEDAIHRLLIPQPDYIKMDVDGIEHLIVKGGVGVLSKVKGMLVEVNEDFNKQADDVAHYLKASGMELKEKRHAEMFEGSERFGHSYNQIWHRPE